MNDAEHEALLTQVMEYMRKEGFVSFEMHLTTDGEAISEFWSENDFDDMAFISDASVAVAKDALAANDADGGI